MNQAAANQQSQGYDDTNKGTLFTNDRKERANQPDYTGKLDIEGKQHYLSAWLKKSQADKTYLSLSVREVLADGNGGKSIDGVLYINDNTENENAPQWSGKIGDLNKRIAGWIYPINSGERAGQNLMSLAVSDPRTSSDAPAGPVADFPGAPGAQQMSEPPAQAANANAPAGDLPDFPDDMPF